jgi:anaerobic magnesium-protoporphyrin IX monomethyl ester cyclase
VNISSNLKTQKVKFVTQKMIDLPLAQAFEAGLKTLGFNITLGPTYKWSSILYPFPGTEVYRYVLESGFLETNEAPILETTRVSSPLKFPSKEEVRRIENLHKLFGIIVNFPFLRKYCETLCELPLTKVYTVFYYLWYGYSLKIKLDSFVSSKKRNSWVYRLFLSCAP